MKLILVSSLIVFIGCTQTTQPMTGALLLKKSIQYHDPDGNWERLNGTVYYDEFRADNTVRKSVVHFNNLNGTFKMERTEDRLVITRGTVGDSCYVLVNGSVDFDTELDSTFNLACERSMMYRNYYEYMQGLPMKLMDSGTIIDPEVEQSTFLGNEYYKLKVTYLEEVGSDVWYFYINPETYAVEAYQFYHDELKGDGEYILLEGLVAAQGMTWPRERLWYTNKDEKYLGKDVIVEMVEN